MTTASINGSAERYEIRILPARTDNYAIFIIDRNSQSCVAIDTPCSRVIGDFLSEQNLTLRYILNTHHHPDHTGGNLELQKRYDCEIIGHTRDRARIPGVNILVNDGDMVEIFEQGLTAKVIAVDGHTIGHIAYDCPEISARFVGDTLFSLGCGRLFEGSAKQMRESLYKLTAPPEHTLLYCAHEYTLGNMKFARHIFPDDQGLRDLETEITALRAENIPTIPTNIQKEKRFNPFLQTDRSEMIQRLIALGALSPEGGKNPDQVFGALRSLKDRF